MPANKNKKPAKRAPNSKPRVLVVPAGTKVATKKGTLVLRRFNGKAKRVSFD